MLKNISNLGTVLNKSEQQNVKGGTEGGGPSLICTSQYGNTSQGVYFDNSGYYTLWYHSSGGGPHRRNISQQLAHSLC